MEGVEVERTPSRVSTARKLHGIANALAKGRTFRVHVNGRRVIIPDDFQLEVNLDTPDTRGEVTVDLWWHRKRRFRPDAKERSTETAGLRQSQRGNE